MRFFNRMSIRLQLMGLAIFTIAAMLTVVFIMYSKTADMTRVKNSEYTSRVFDQIKRNIDSNCQMISNLLVGLAYNTALQEYVMEPDDARRFEKMANVRTLFSSAKRINKGIVDIAFVGRDGFRYDLLGTSRFLEGLDKEIPARAESYFSSVKQLEIQSGKIGCILAATPVYSVLLKSTGVRIGTLYVVLDKRMFSYYDGEDPAGMDNRIYLLDRGGFVFSTNDPEQENRKFALVDIGSRREGTPYTTRIRGEQSIVHVRELNAIGGSIIGIVAEEKLFSGIREARREAIKAFFLALLLLAVPFVLILSNIVRPIRKMTHFMTAVGGGNLKTLKKRIALDGHSEITLMAKEFNGMLDEIQSLTHRLVDTSSRLYETELERKKSQMSFLQSQINPHFLYNTLEAIKGIAAVRGVNEIRDMTKALAQIMYYSIKGEETATVGAELKIAAAYFTIQTIRFNNRFEVHYEFDDRILTCTLPKMLLQPLVENAVYHGLEPKRGKGHVWLGGALDENGDVNLWVRDDGVGMAPEVLAHLTQYLDTDPLVSGSADGDHYHIGMGNVSKRLKLAYGPSYGLQINSEPDRGTMVIIKIPARWE